MRVLYYFLNYNTSMFQWQKFHIIDELAQHGYYIEIISPTSFYNTDQANEEIVNKIRTGLYQLFLTSLNHFYLYPETLGQIKHYGVPTLLFCPDNLVAPYNHERIANKFDLVWLTSKETNFLFKRWHCKTVFLPYAANPLFLTPEDRIDKLNRIGFIGNPYGSRSAMISKLVSSGIPVTIHTNSLHGSSSLIATNLKDYLRVICNYSRYKIGRKIALASVVNKLYQPRSLNSESLQYRDAVSLEQLSTTYNKYSMLLSFTDALHTGILPNPVKIVNLRNFEIPMSGGLQFCTYSEELASYFVDGKEII